MSQTKFTDSALFKAFIGASDTTEGSEENKSTSEESSGGDAATVEAERLAAEETARLAAEQAGKEKEEGNVSDTESGKEDEGKGKPTKFNVGEKYNEWSTENEDALAEYFVQKRTDFKSMAPEKLLIRKLSEENPSLTIDEVKELFNDNFGVPEKIEIDEDLMDSSEVRAAKLHNTDVDKTLRKLNAEAKKVAAEFEKRKDTLEKPIFSVDVSESTGDVEKYTEEEFADRYAAGQEASQKELQDKWVAIVDDSVKPVDKFEYRELSIPLSEEDNKAIKSAVLGYVAQPGDQERFSDGKGGVDMVKFKEHVAKGVLLDRLLDAAGSSSKEEIAKRLANHETYQGNERSSESNDGVITAESLWKSMKAGRR